VFVNGPREGKHILNRGALPEQADFLEQLGRGVSDD
jgi:hypothetical protein